MEEFQVSSSSKRGSNHHNKRVYIGNLPNTFESCQALEESLEQWIREKLPNLSTESSIQVNTSGRGKFPHALLECGAQANLVIRSLHQQTWQGQRLNVQREKRNTNHEGNTKMNKKPGFGGQSWLAPTTPSEITDTAKSMPTFSHIPIDQATLDIQSVVEDEVKQAEESGDDLINVALASTAAASFLAAMNALDLEDAASNDNLQDSTPTNWEHKSIDNDHDNNQYDDDEDNDGGDDDQIDEPETFQLKPMAELLADFGQADPTWKTKSVDTDIASTDKDAPTSQLAPKGKAPIHICLTSFGFSKGAPKRMDGWSHKQPLLPLDCRAFPTVPHYLTWQDGLSAAVKRSLQYPQDREKIDSKESKQSLYNFARNTVATQVWNALLDAQNQGGHGYVSPLEMTIFIGSESGRHRSVVVCEWAAKELRKRLRANATNAVQQPVSVGAFHRDVESHRQHQYKSKSSNSKVGNETGQQGKTIKKKQMDFAGDW